MTNPLTEIILHEIKTHGPMDIGRFMTLALAHPEYGYYMKQDPFGAQGDFTTAPEISQMFGELLGAWIADLWTQAGRPADFLLLECGPGRGTLMADMMRATKNVPGFHEACGMHLLETSPVLRDIQAQQLEEYKPSWHQTLETLPDEGPVFVVANEFLDALPVRQLEMTHEGWRERVIAGHEGKPALALMETAVSAACDRAAKPGDVYEISPARTGFIKNLCQIMKPQGGAALIIDYGHDGSAFGDTFQALYKHEYTDPLSHIGDADLTAHINFSYIKEAASQEGAGISGPVEQGAFLRALGIGQRAAYLSGKADEKQKKDIQSALIRLIDPGEMGTLFKAMGIYYGERLKPAGF